MSARFQVVTVTGYRIHLPVSVRGNWNAPEGLSATVCDTAHLYRDVRTYRSEDIRSVPGGGGSRLGRDGALAAARDHARYLNGLYGAV